MTFFPSQNIAHTFRLTPSPYPRESILKKRLFLSSCSVNNLSFSPIENIGSSTTPARSAFHPSLWRKRSPREAVTKIEISLTRIS